VDDAQALMKMFGKTEQDIINDFEKKVAEKKNILCYNRRKKMERR
jgi:hypothetical protein